FFNDNGAAIVAVDPAAVLAFQPCALALVDPSYIHIFATNIVIKAGSSANTVEGLPASLIVGPHGEMLLKGTNVDLSRAGLEVLPVWDETFGTAITVPPSNFIPDIAMSDLIWAQTNFNQNFPVQSASYWDGSIATSQGSQAGVGAP